jgi:hypothetical protein
MHLRWPLDAPSSLASVSNTRLDVSRLSHDGINDVLILLADHLTRARGCSTLLFGHEAMCFAEGNSS